MAETAPEADTDKATPNNAPARSSSIGFQMGTRQSSSNARINEILENARERAESMAATGSSPTNPSPRPTGSPILPPNSALKSNPVNEDSSADEATGFISHTPPLNYSSLNVTSSAAASGSHPRKTSARSLHQRPSSQRNNNGTVPSPQASPQNEPDTESTSWLKAQIGKFHSIELENKGSVARDHLAIERTFLAWLRTSLSFASIGVAITQLFRLNTSLESGHRDHISDKNAATLRHMGKPLGTTFLGISILVLFLGYKRYFQTQHWVIQGKFPASRGTIMIVGFVALAIMIVSLVVVIAIHPSEKES